MPDLDRCPVCGTRLEPRVSEHGHVMLCPDGHGGATTLALLKRSFPEAFTRALWRSAREDVEFSERDCPLCSQPLSVAGARGMEVCLHCQGVWVGAEALATARLAESGSGDALNEVEALAKVEALGAANLDSPWLPDELETFLLSRVFW